jgi:hypothetical protein
MEEDEGSKSTPISLSSSAVTEEEALKSEIDKEVARYQSLLPQARLNFDELLKKKEELGFAGIPLPGILEDSESLRKYVIHQVKYRKRKRKEEKENKPSINVIKKKKVQETTMPPLQDETNAPSQKNLLEKK